MKKSEIKFDIQLDKDNIPEYIKWEASDNPDSDFNETKAISISLWDHIQKNTLRIDLWVKEMTVDEMKRFYIDSIGGLGQSLMRATGDEFMSEKINELCDTLVQYIKNEEKNN
ncbi:MAG TPA: gliding motility protein GldC [Cytophagales bacterium]|nr:gliding motility protein GldC [Cytophagales bacterium]